MKLRSFLRVLDPRWFSGLKLRPTPPIRRTPVPLHVETLETRTLPSARPTIIAVAPADGSSVSTATPQLTVTYSEPMGPSAAVAGNYLLFGSSGNSVGVTSVTLTGPDASGHETATLTYNGSTTGLVLDTYTLFVRGDLIAADTTVGGLTMTLPGQVVVANNGRTDASVVTLPGNGSLGAVSQYGLPTGSSSTTVAAPVAVAMGDLNGDSVNDLAVLSPGTSEIDIFLGQSGGGYSLSPNQKLTLSSTETGNKAILLGKFSGGALPDIVVSNNTSGNVTAFQNQSTAGNLQFGGAIDFTVSNGPAALAAADFDGDGKLDLVVTNTTADSTSNYNITILPGLGNSSFFGTAKTIAVGNSTAGTGVNPTAIAGGLVGNSTISFDNNNTPDLVLAGSTGAALLLNSSTGTGKFSFTQQSLTTSAMTNVAAAVLQVNSPAPTQADVVTLDAANKQADVWLNAGSASVGSASFASPQTYAVGSNPQGLALAPLVPGDSRLDIVLTQNNGDTTAGGSGSLTLLQNISTAGNPSFAAFASSSSYATDGNTVGVAVGDTNGDGIPDLVALNNSTNDFTLLQGAASPNLGTFLNAGNTTLTPQLVAVAAGDLNGDGLPDLVFAENSTGTGSSTVTVMLAQSSGGYSTPFSYSPSVTGGTVRNVVSIAIGDITGDGKPDILLLDQQDATAGVLANTIGSSTATLNGNSFTTDTPVTLSGSGFRGVKVAAPTQILLAPFTSNSKTNNLNDILVSSLGSSGKFGGTAGGVMLLPNTTTTKTTSYTFGSTAALTGTLAAQGVAAADFNADGALDFVVIYTNSGSGYAGVYLNNGSGSKFSLQNNTPITLDIASPVSVAAGDLNGDGLPDFIVASQSTSLTAGGLDVVLNSFGTGFAKPAQTQVLPGTALQNVLIANLNNDLFPDIVVTTLPGTGGSKLDNVYALLNNGDGTLQSPLPYLAGGSASPTLAPSYAVAVGNPLVRATTFHSGGSTVNTNLIVNGDFEAKDLNGVAGNLLGWQTYDLPNSPGGSYGLWSVQTGTTSPLSYTTVTAPTSKYQAMLDEPNQQPYQNSNPNSAASYAGSHALYQDITIPNTATKVTLSMSLILANQASSWSDNTTGGPQLLDYRTTSANQQVRVDIIDTNSADILGYTTATGVLQNIFLSTSTTTLTTSMAITADLSAFHGQTVRLRVAETNNQGLLIVGVDNVKVNALFNDTFSPTITTPSLRNPGFTDSSDALVNGALPQHTTDPTIVARVGDTGSVNNISYVEIDPNNTNFTGSTLYKISTFDPLGNFTFTIPSVFPGLQTVEVMAVNKAGGSASTTFAFYYQGPSATDWQAFGPNAIDTTGQGVNYKSVSGSITAIAADPTDTSGNTYYVGSINGGVWKTTDGGNDWTPLTDFVTDSGGNAVPVPVGGLAVSQALNPATKTHVVYAGTGVGLNVPDARGGFGVLISTDNGATWKVNGNSGTVLSGARITAVVVDNDDPNTVYAAVASGGTNGPGVYKTTNALSANATWSIVTSDSVMFTGSTTATLTNGTALASVTSLIEDPFNNKRLIMGMGNIGLTSASSSAGVWLSINKGQSWTLEAGGDGGVSNSKIPTGTNVGRVTVAMGTGREGDENTVYALFGAPPSSTNSPNFNYGSDLAGNAGSALYKSSNNMLDWTNVMLTVNTSSTPGQPFFSNLTLLGGNAANAGALVVDPGDVNVVYVGGSTRYGTGGPGGTVQPFIRVDTGNIDGAGGGNTGDDATKRGQGLGNYYYYDPTTMTYSDPYVGEGVYWYSLEQNVINDANGKGVQLLPPNIQSLAFDAQGRLLIGTDGGLFRGVSLGYGYDFTSGGQGYIRAGKGQSVISPPGMTITALNGNLQIADLTSVAIDPTNYGVLYTTMFNTGTAASGSVLNWASEGLTGPVTSTGGNLGVTTASVVRASSQPPNTPAETPTTLYRFWEYANSAALFPETSTNSGQTFTALTGSGIPVTNNAPGTFPAFVVNPTPFLNSTLYENQLLYGTSRVFITNTSGTVWDQFSPVLSSNGGLLTTLAFAPSSDSVYFAGDNLGEIFATTNDGGQWTEVDSKMPAVSVNAIVVDPNNAGTVYAMYGSNTIGLVFVSTNDGGAWTNITSSLPSTVKSANAMVIIPTTSGKSIYLATNVGVFVSTNGGTNWARVGVGLPNVPVVDLQWNSTLGVLAAATQGRGVYTLSTDKTGPHVTALALGSVTTTTFGGLDVTFNKPINANTVSASNITVTGPGGSTIGLSSAVSIDSVNNEQFQVNFSTPQSTNGFYTITLGPTIADFVGNQMDQNQNGVNGESPGDVFAGRILFQPGTNHAPSLGNTSATFTFPAVNEDGFTASNDSLGVSVQSLVTGSPAAFPITDADTGAVKGVAITAINDTTGTWQYSQNSGTLWSNIPTTVSETNALLLQATSSNLLRFVPGSGYQSVTIPGNNVLGTSSFTFRAWDLTSGLNALTGADGGFADTTANGGATAFSSGEGTAVVQVVYDNHAPSFTNIGNQNVLESGATSPAFTTVSNWAKNISPGTPSNESSQTLTFHVANSNSGLFTSAGQPTISANGTLSYEQAQYANGTATVTVALTDNGGTANFGSNSSSSITFTINIAAVNQQPSFTQVGGNETITESGSVSPAFSSYSGWASSISPGPSNESSQTTNFILANSNPGLFLSTPTISSNGTLSFEQAQYANGVDTVTVALHDSGGTSNGGADTSSSITFTITILPVNQAPSFNDVGNETITVDNGPNLVAQTISNWATNISAGPSNESAQTLNFLGSNNDTTLFTTSGQPSISANGTLTFTPAANADGSATVTVALHDSGGTSNGGVDTSSSITFTITVAPVNQAPTFTVTGTGNDTVLESGNASPAFTTVSGLATNLSAGASYESWQSLNFQVANSNTSLFTSGGQPTITVAGNATAGFTGTLSFQQAQYANGVDTVTVALHDNGGTAHSGADTSSSITFTITILPVNQPPSFSDIGNQTVLESGSATPAVTNVSGWASSISAGPSNESSQTVNFLVANSNPGLFTSTGQPTISSNGTLSFQQAQYANGVDTVTVALQDSGGTANGGVDTSSSITFTISVTAVNQPPSFGNLGNQSTLESAAATPAVVSIPGWASSISAGPSNESSQTVNFLVANSNPGLFLTVPTVSPTGTLSYQAKQYAAGVDTVTVALHDSGGTSSGGVDTSSSITFTVTLTPVNQPPSFTAGPDETVTADTGPNPAGFTIPKWATNLSAGPSNESSQSLNFVVVNDNGGLFSAPPVVSPSGTLTFTPAPFANGSADVTVALHDSGGTSNGGVDTSSSITFHIHVTPVNQPPGFAGGPDQTSSIGDGVHTVGNWATSISAGPGSESWQSLSFSVTSTNPGLFSVQPTVAPNGTLTYQPGTLSGTAQVMVALKDNGGTANGGSDTSAVYTFNISVNPLITSGPADLVWVAQLYRDLLGREIRPDEVGFWSTESANDTPRFTMAQQLLNSTEYRTAFIQNQFNTYLGHAANGDGLNYYLGRFQGGATPDAVKAEILGSDEYTTKNGGTALNFLSAVYRDVLGMSLDDVGRNLWGGQLAQGMTRQAVALEILQSRGADLHVVQVLYPVLFGRQADDGANFWVGQLQGGTRDEDVIAGMAASPEFGLIATARFYNSGPDVKWLNQLFEDTLGRPLDNFGSNYFVSQIRQGAGRAGVVQQLFASQEYKNDEVTAAFDTIFHQPPDGTSLAAYSNYLSQGYSIVQVQALLFGTPTFYSAQGGTTDGFLTGLYLDGLGRSPDVSGAATLASQLAQGMTLPNIIPSSVADPVRESVALSLLTSPEADRRLVVAAYAQFMRRTVDGDGLSFWSGQLASGLTEEQFYQKLLSSREYYQAHSV
jgi:hypothetical protein